MSESGVPPEDSRLSRRASLLAGMAVVSAGCSVARVGADDHDIFPELQNGKLCTVDIASVFVPASVMSFRTSGYEAPGDGGGSLFRRVDKEPSHPGRAESADGAFWELVLERGVIDVRQMGAKGDGSMDDSQAVQDASDTGASVVWFSTGTFVVGEVNLTKRGQQVVGADWDKTRIIGTGEFVFSIGNDQITIRDLWFYPRTYVVNRQDVSMTSVPLRFRHFSDLHRALTGILVTRVRMSNYAAAGMLIESPLRESYLELNDFRRMGTRDVGTVVGRLTPDAKDSANNLHIRENRFFGGAAPFIDLQASGAPASVLYGPLWIDGNHFHAQTLDSTGNEESVVAEPTDMVHVQSVTSLRVLHNNFASYHGDHRAVHVVGLVGAQPNDSAFISGNRFAVDNGESYSGSAIQVEDTIMTLVSQNQIKAGRHSQDIRVVNSGAFPFRPQVHAQNNFSTNRFEVAVELPETVDIQRQTVSNTQHSAVTSDGPLLARGTTTLSGPLRMSAYAGNALLEGGATSASVSFSSPLPSTNYMVFLQPQGRPVAAWPSAKGLAGFTINVEANSGSLRVSWWAVRL